MVLDIGGFAIQTHQNFEEISIDFPNDIFDFEPHGIGQPVHNVGVFVVCGGRDKLKVLRLET